MITLNIDNIAVKCQSKISILNACKIIGITIPRFCYHEMLSVAGNCRMCLVEIDMIEKPIVSCATEAKSGMEIFVSNAFVQKARENVLELLLINHPLDCPICDQAGECDLQDQVRIFGASHSRYFYLKKTSEDKVCNPLIKTIMTRCITCTRCVRFATEIAGVEFFGTLNRGRDTEIGSYISALFDSEISANVVDLCPVGALNSGPYSYKGRPWELRSTESIDIMDSLGSSIFVNHKENKIYRVLPKSNTLLNGSVISDIARYSFDHVFTQRITKTYVAVNGLMTAVEFLYNRNNIISRFFPTLTYNCNIYIDQKMNTTLANYLKQLSYFSNHKVNIRLYENVLENNNFYLSQNFFLTNIIQNLKEYCITLGCNIRTENPIFNSKIKFKHRFSTMNVLNLGFNGNFNIPNKIIALNINTVFNFFEGLSLYLSREVIKISTSILLLGESFLSKFSDVLVLNSSIKKLNSGLITLFMSTKNNFEGINIFNFKNMNNKLDNQYSLNMYINIEDNIKTRKMFTQKNKFNVWLNTNGSTLAARTTKIMPITTSFEQKHLYINLEHRPQRTERSITLGHKFFNTAQLINRNFQVNVDQIKSSHLEYCDELVRIPTKYHNQDNNDNSFLMNKCNNAILLTSTILKTPMKQQIKDYYYSNMYVKNSRILNECSYLYQLNYKNLT
jgi:NADH-quinone oxidoreductase subunit G